ncbi:MAG TPA: hypothetical protein VHQ90_04380 [Thermoanaerobaculia bacterium]|nr:hypothetical protein [Thermoanaerobaculia bacterium]
MQSTQLKDISSHPSEPVRLATGILAGRLFKLTGSGHGVLV